MAPLVNRWIERLLAGHDPPLSVSQFLALEAIATEEVSGTELARRASISGAAVSQLLAGLARAGLLERRERAEDRRRQSLALSTMGQSVLRSARQLLRVRLESLLDGLPRPEIDALARALPKVAGVLTGAPPPRRPHPPRQHPPPRHTGHISGRPREEGA